MVYQRDISYGIVEGSNCRVVALAFQRITFSTIPVTELVPQANSPASSAPGIVPSDSPLALIVDMLARESGEDARSSRAYRWTFWLTVVLLAIGGTALVLSKYWHGNALLWVAGIALALAAIAAPINVFLGVREAWVDLKGLEVDLLRSLSRRLTQRRNLALEIGAAFSHREIIFARDYLRSAVSQTRSRIALIIGAIDKIGVLAIMGTVGVTLLKLPDQGVLSYTLYGGTVVVVLFYMVFAHMWATVSSYEHHVVLLEHAAQHAQERGGEFRPQD